MKNFFKFVFLASAVSLFVSACNNSSSTKTNSDTTSVIDSMPVDSTASGDTAVVVDSVKHNN